MMHISKLLSVLLKQFSEAVERLSDEQLRRLLTGEARLSVSVRRNTERQNRKREIASVEFREDFPELHEKFRTAKSVEECAVMVEYLLSNKEEMFAFAKYIHLSVQRKDSQKRIRDKIVDATAGARLRSEIIRGGY